MRERWPVVGYILPSQSHAFVILWMAPLLGAGLLVAVSYAVRYLPTGKSLGIYLTLVVMSSVASGFRRGQVFYEQERKRALDFASISNSDPVELYRTATTNSTRSLAILLSILAPLVQITYHYVTGEPWRQTLAALLACELLLCAFYARTLIAHLAAYAEKVQPPQLLYLFAGFSAAAVLNSSVFSYPTLDGPSVAILLSTSRISLVITAGLIIVSLWIFRRSGPGIANLVNSGPFVWGTRGPRWQRLFPRFLPASMWVQPGRSSGSVVFGFALAAAGTTLAVEHYRLGIQGVKPPYGGAELIVAAQFAVAVALAFTFCAPLELGKLGAMGQLFRLARVNIANERTKIFVAACLPTLIATSILDYLMSWGTPGSGTEPDMVASLGVWISGWLCTTAAALSFSVAPALSRRMDGGHLSDEDVPISEMMRVVFPCVLLPTLIAGYATTAPGATIRIAIFSLTGVIVALVGFARLGFLARKVR